jgi:hypothetical protein
MIGSRPVSGHFPVRAATRKLRLSYRILSRNTFNFNLLTPHRIMHRLYSIGAGLPYDNLFRNTRGLGDDGLFLGLQHFDRLIRPIDILHEA